MKWCLGKRGNRETGKPQLAAEEKRKKGGRFWFRRGCGCGPAPLRGALPLCGRASCASCAPSCPCGGGAGSGGLVGLVEQNRAGIEGDKREKKRAGDLLKKSEKSGKTDVRVEMNH